MLLVGLYIAHLPFFPSFCVVVFFHYGCLHPRFVIAMAYLGFPGSQSHRQPVDNPGRLHWFRGKSTHGATAGGNDIHEIMSFLVHI
jgi:hypothetical protein